MSASVHFSIKYDGPALVTHQMDVRELAPALIALSTLLEEANRAAYPDSSEVRVNVQGNFKGGSFGVDLIAVQSIAEQIVSMLAGPTSTAAANLLAILGGIGLLGSGGLIGIVKWLRGRKPTAIRLYGDKTIFENPNRKSSRLSRSIWSLAGSTRVASCGSLLPRSSNRSSATGSKCSLAAVTV